MTDSLQKQVNRKQAGIILTRQDFPDYHEEFVGFTLSESVASGVLLRLAQGIYYKPIITELGVSLPFAQEVVEAI